MDQTAYSDGASGSYLDGFTSWFGDFAYRYSERWLDEEFPEQSEPLNPDHVTDPAATTQQEPTKSFGIDGNTMLIGGVVLAAILLLK